MGRIGSGELIGIVPEGEVYAAVYCYTGYPDDPQLSVRWWIRPPRLQPRRLLRGRGRRPHSRHPG